MKIKLLAVAMLAILASCESNATRNDIKTQEGIGDRLAANQPTPTDISYSLERYNLIRRAYWVNGMKEKAMTVARPAEVPMGYCVLLTESGTVIGQFAVDGKVTCLNSYLTPSNAYIGTSYEKELPDVDGSYGENDVGIFFFTPSWQYIEWDAHYLYSDSPFKISDTVLGEY